jgi:hypothetical protein
MTELIQSLSAWLDKPVYADGVVLYQKHIGTGFMLSMLQNGPDDYNRKYLRDALTEKRDQLTLEHQAKVSSYPEHLVEKLDAGGLLMDERTIKKEHLRLAFNSGIDGNQQTFADTARIIEIVDTLGQTYGEKDFFEEHGYLPDAAGVEVELAPDKLKQRQLSVRAYVSKYKGYVEEAEAAGDTPKSSHVAKLAKYRTELHQLDQQLIALNQSHGNAHFD